MTADKWKYLSDQWQTAAMAFSIYVGNSQKFKSPNDWLEKMIEHYNKRRKEDECK